MSLTPWFRSSLPLLVALQPLAVLSPAQAQGQIQLVCDGALVEARGNAELKRSTDRLQVSLSLEAEAPTADGALAELQARLAAVRSGLQRLEVKELEVTSPSTWQRPAERQRPAAVQASLQVTGQLAPARLQELIRKVGPSPGCVWPPWPPRPTRPATGPPSASCCAPPTGTPWVRPARSRPPSA